MTQVVIVGNKADLTKERKGKLERFKTYKCFLLSNERKWQTDVKRTRGAFH